MVFVSVTNTIPLQQTPISILPSVPNQPSPTYIQQLGKLVLTTANLGIVSPNEMNGPNANPAALKVSFVVSHAQIYLNGSPTSGQVNGLQLNSGQVTLVGDSSGIPPSIISM